MPGPLPPVAMTLDELSQLTVEQLQSMNIDVAEALRRKQTTAGAARVNCPHQDAGVLQHNHWMCFEAPVPNSPASI